MYFCEQPVAGEDNGSHDDLDLDALSAEERKLFFKAVADGSLGRLVAPWKPW